MADLLGDPREAALLSLATGLVILSVLVCPGGPAQRAGAWCGRYRSGGLVWWRAARRARGAAFIAGQSIVVPESVWRSSPSPWSGAQTANSLVVDRAGLGPSGHQPITAARVVAAIVAVFAVVISVWGKSATFALGPLLLALVAGALIAVQYAVNGRVAVATGQPVDAAWVNFVVGFTALLVVFLLGSVALGGGAHSLPTTDWWLYLTGPIGVVFVALAAWVVRLLGVLLFSLSVVSGQLAGAVLIDVISPTGTQTVGVATLVGVALTVVAVAIGSGLLRVRRRPWQDQPT